MHAMLKGLLAVGGLALAMQAGAQVTLFSGYDFHGRQLTVDRTMWDLDRTNFNDRAASLIVDRGRWQVCEDARFQGRCVTLRPGRYGSLDRMGLDKRISSIRPLETYGRAQRYDQWHDYGYSQRDYDYRR